MKHKLQTMLKHKLQWLLLLAALLGVSQGVWALSLSGDYYFDNSNAKWSNVYLIVGKSGWTQAIKMVELCDGIYYVNVSWNDASKFFFANSNLGYGEGGGSNADIGSKTKTGNCTSDFSSAPSGKKFTPSTYTGTSISGSWSAFSDDQYKAAALKRVLRDGYIMFYIGEPSSWTQSIFYLLNSSNATVAFAHGSFENDSKKFGPIVAPSATGYKITHALNWTGGTTFESGHPVKGGAYYENNSFNKKNGTALTASVTLSSSSITQGSNVTISSSSKSDGILGLTSQIKYYATNDDYDTFTELSVTNSTTLVTSGLTAGTWTICAVFYDTKIYCKGTERTLTVNSACTPAPSTGKTITIDESEVCEDTEVTVTVGSSQSGYIYRVYDNAATPNKVGEEESNGGNLDISFTPSASATYTVKAVKMDGCAETEVGANTVSVTVNALPTISLTGTGAVDATHTYPWEWMTVTATTSPSNLTVSWSTSFSGPSGGLENSMEEIGSPNHTYKVKSNRSLSGDQHTMNIDVTGTVTDANGCSNSAMHRFYNNQVPAETCN